MRLDVRRLNSELKDTVRRKANPGIESFSSHPTRSKLEKSSDELASDVNKL